MNELLGLYLICVVLVGGVIVIDFSRQYLYDADEFWQVPLAELGLNIIGIVLAPLFIGALVSTVIIHAWYDLVTERNWDKLRLKDLYKRRPPAP